MLRELLKDDKTLIENEAIIKKKIIELKESWEKFRVVKKLDIFIDDLPIIQLFCHDWFSPCTKWDELKRGHHGTLLGMEIHCSENNILNVGC